MNANQTKALVGGVLVFLLALLVPPWTVESTNPPSVFGPGGHNVDTRWAWLFDPPQFSVVGVQVTMNFGILAMEWVAIAVATGVVCFLLKTPPKK
jgi:hypothetical protein